MTITKNINNFFGAKVSKRLSLLNSFNFYKLALITYNLLLITYSSAQTVDTSAYLKYTFIKKELNKIENDSNSLNAFYEKLYQLEKTKTSRISIAHIGDSHIQADHFSGAMRQKLQLRFGNAGRGLIFPYRVAKSNEPASYKTTTNVIWDAKRNVFYEKPLPIGISGFTIESGDSIAEINLMVKDQPCLGYSFTKFTLFHEKGPNNYDITICDDLNCERGTFSSSTDSINPFVSELKFEKPLCQIILRNKVTDTTQKATRIYGMLLENDSSGIMYNMIGVNGAEFKHYNMSKYFMQQFPYLDPNLVIVSMGTNEAYHVGFDPALFYKNIDTLITNIRSANPNAFILLTTPADSYRKTRKGRIKNPDMKMARLTIINYCLQHKLPYWDLYEIMGGYGSMGKWYLAKLTSKDRVHFTGRGYQIQGDLFYKALMSGYERYVKSYK
ncbi:MAG: GDSL-type esterase/lipase family protein [Bacteroidota bacterium]